MLIRFFLLLFFLLFPICDLKATGSVIFNEIAWMGTLVSASDEWIELKNTTNETIDLTGWTLKAQDGTPNIILSKTIEPNGYFLLERTNDDTVPSVQADLIYVGDLGNGGEFLELYDNASNLIDIFDCISTDTKWPAGNNITKQTLARDNFDNWQDSLEVGGTPRQINFLNLLENQQQNEEQIEQSASSTESQNQIEQTATSTSQGGSSLLQASSTPLLYHAGDIVINELVSDPVDGEDEWIELYNNLTKNIDLTGWMLEEGSGAKTNLNGSIGFNGDDRFLVIYKIKGNLNNGGEIIKLFDQNKTLIDQVIYGNWQGNQSSQLPIAPDPDSLARLYDGQNTFNNLTDFAITSVKTPGQSNQIAMIDEKTDTIKAKEKDFVILITEILPNPVGDDLSGEWIELFNPNDTEINLFNWQLNDDSETRFKIPEIKLKSQEYLVLKRAQTKLALNNDGDIVKLYNATNHKVAEVKFKKSLEGLSYNLFLASSTKDQNWEWSEIITPGEKNILRLPNRAPQVDFSFPLTNFVNLPVLFDSSDTIDEDGDDLKYNWQFGDKATSTLINPEHSFFKAGSFKVVLKVSDGKISSETQKTIKILAPEKIIELDSLPVITIATTTNPDAKVLFNEILPNPTGPDAENEWIELFNPNKISVNLLNWRLTDGEEKKSYLIPSLDLVGQDFLVLKRKKTNFSLNNTLQTIRLFNDWEKLIDEVSYARAPQGQAWARNNQGIWSWTTVLTPEQENVFNEIKKTTVIKKTSVKSASVKPKFSAVKGVVLVRPGVLGAQFFYLQASSSPVQIFQIYNYKKDFPLLNIGDEIMASGELYDVGNEIRLKTQAKKDIQILKTLARAPEPIFSACSGLINEPTGKLVKIAGEITDKKGAIFYVDDGTDEAKIYLKKNANIQAKNFAEGDEVEVAGILRQDENGPQILPRDSFDFIKTAQASVDLSDLLPGETIKDPIIALAEKDKKLELFQYLLILSVGGIVVLGGMLFLKK